MELCVRDVEGGNCFLAILKELSIQSIRKFVITHRFLTDPWKGSYLIKRVVVFNIRPLEHITCSHAYSLTSWGEIFLLGFNCWGGGCLCFCFNFYLQL